MRNVVIKIALVFALWCGTVHANQIANIRIWPAPDNTRVVFDLSATPNYSYFTLYDTKPYRLVIDFNNTKLATDLAKITNRSEEHTSELQSRENLVCRLLLEKKKIKKEHNRFRED